MKVDWPDNEKNGLEIGSKYQIRGIAAAESQVVVTAYVSSGSISHSLDKVTVVPNKDGVFEATIELHDLPAWLVGEEFTHVRIVVNQNDESAMILRKLKYKKS